MGANLLAPPDGDINTIDDVVERLKAFAKSPNVERTGWIFGMGYDDALLGRHPTREDLDKGFSTNYSNHYRLGGLKVTFDGSPQGRTAWRTVPYLIQPDGQNPGYLGYPAIPDTKQVEAYLDEAYAKGWPVKVHTNGDAAVEQLFAALRPVVEKHGVKPGQTILVHGQFIRPDQVKELKSLGIFPSMFPMHTFYWGDWYGKIIGPDERVTPCDAMQMITIWVLETIKDGKSVWVRM